MVRRPVKQRAFGGATRLATAFARFSALLLLLAFGWRVSGAYLTPCSPAPAAPLAASSTVPLTASSTAGDATGAGASQRDDHEGGCCDDEASGDTPSDGEGDCSCPIHCGSCCDGAVMHALPAEVPTIVAGFADLVELNAAGRPSARADAEARGILHVPRAS